MLFRSGSSIIRRFSSVPCRNIWDFRKQTGFLSADLQKDYLPHVTGEEVILSGLTASNGIYSRPTERHCSEARQLAQELSIDHLLHKTIGTLSSGEQRRFLIGRALIHKPKLLIYDEPCSGLDLQAREQFLTHTEKMLTAARTLILVTHHPQEIPAAVTHAALMQKGSLVAKGRAEKILTAKNLSQIFETGIRVSQRKNGRYEIHLA